MSKLELFDGLGRFVMPSEAAITAANLDHDEQQLFDAVCRAHDQCLAAIATLGKLVAKIAETEAALTAARERLAAARPRITATELAKQHIASERAWSLGYRTN